MTTKRLKNKTEIEDFVRGATYYGTGGGGAAEGGIEVLGKLLEDGKEICWTDASEIGDGVYTACPFGMGSIAPKTEEAVREREKFGCSDVKFGRGDNFVRALAELEKEVGHKIDVLVPIELGGGNSSACIAAAMTSGRKVVDGDYTGRAIPAIFQTTPYIHEMEMLPLTSCDAWGNIAVVREAVNWRMGERIGKMLSVAGFTGCGMAGFAMPGGEMKKALVHGSLSECYELGRAIREARENGGDPVKAGADKLNGWVLCRGSVSKKEWWDKDGYLWGWHTIRQGGDEYKVFYQNENHLCYKNGSVLLTSPDMIIVTDAATGEPLTNTVITEGMEVALTAAKARDIFRSPRGLEALGPQNFGENAPYVPVEEKMFPLRRPVNGGF